MEKNKFNRKKNESFKEENIKFYETKCWDEVREAGRQHYEEMINESAVREKIGRRVWLCYEEQRI